MNKQLILAGAGILLVLTLFLFTKTTSSKKSLETSSNETSSNKSFNPQQFIVQEKAKLSPEYAVILSKLENEVKRGDINTQQIKANYAIANFWKDSIKLFEPYAFYFSTASKLENSEKNLTFAARLFLGNLRGERDEAKITWEADQSIDLFNRALKLNPENDDIKIGIGAAYIYGKGRDGNAQETMEGIQTLLSVAKNDSNNMKAQMMLGVGGIVSRQFDKAILRLEKVVSVEPNNAEAVAYLADAYAGKGDKAAATKWYNISKRLINDVHYSQEVDERIKNLK